jgi:hypothetical protein
MDKQYRFILVLLVLLNVLLVGVLCSVVLDTRADVNQLTAVLATKQDLVNVAAPRMTFFHEAKCTSCHTERRFAGPHNVRGEIEQALAEMRQMPDTHFTDEDMAKIHSSLTMLRCVECHGAETLRLLAIKSPQERMEIIRKMIAKPGSRISPDEASDIQRSYEMMMGF